MERDRWPASRENWKQNVALRKINECSVVEVGLLGWLVRYHMKKKASLSWVVFRELREKLTSKWCIQMICLFSVVILMFDLSSPYIPSTVELVRQASDSVKLKGHCQGTSLLLSLSLSFYVIIYLLIAFKHRFKILYKHYWSTWAPEICGIYNI